MAVMEMAEEQGARFELLFHSMEFIGHHSLWKLQFLKT
jgi:hypothetical protein